MPGYSRKIIIQVEYAFDSLSQVTWPPRETSWSSMMETPEDTDALEVFKENSKIQDLLFINTLCTSLN